MKTFWNGEFAKECLKAVVKDILPDKNAFDRRQIIGARSMGHSVFEILRQLGFSRSTTARVYQEYMDGGQKTNDRANCKGQLALTVRGMKGHHTASTNLTELPTALVNIWQVTPVERLKKLVESMPRHIAAFMKDRGGPTRY
ncbi:uncharacterized protein TNCV_3000781 [Trichonephila clavipes]|nr:uncharacterized protein TNCV_3000781 [Trichonephila clavipes]